MRTGANGVYCKPHCKQCAALHHCVDTRISIGLRRAKFVCSPYVSLLVEERAQKLLAVGSFKSVRIKETTRLSNKQTIHGSNIGNFSYSCRLVHELMRKAE